MKLQFHWWVLSFLAIILIRNFLESILEKPYILGFSRDIFESQMLFFGHYTLWHIGSLFLLSLILHSVTKVKIEKITKVVISFYWITCLVPVADFIIGQGQGFIIVYATGWKQLLKFLNPVILYNPFNNAEVLTPSIKSELLVALILISTYILSRTRKFFFLITGLILYHLIFVSFYVAGAGLLFSEILYQGTGVQLAGRSFYHALFFGDSLVASPHQRFSAFFLIVSLLFFLIWFYHYNRKKFLLAMKNIRIMRALHYMLLALSGVFLGRFCLGREFAGPFSNPFDYFAVFSLLVSIVLAWASGVVINDYFDKEQDKERNPLVTGKFSVYEYFIMGGAYTIIALALSLCINYSAFLILVFYLSLHLLYSAPPLRIKRILLLNNAFISLKSFSAFIFGYSIFGREDTIVKFPLEMMLALLCFYFLASNIIHLKDVREDRKANVLTIPVVLGQKWGKIVLAACLFLAFISTLSLIHI